MPFLSKKTRYDKSPSFGENHGLVLTPLQKIKFCEYIRDIFYGLKRLVSYSENHQTIFYGLFKQKASYEKKTQIFGQNHGLTPLEKLNFANIFLWVKRLVSYSEHHQIIFYSLFRQKTSDEKNSNFWPKSWVNPFTKNQISRIYKLYIFMGKEACFLFRTSPNNILWPF